jgi:hypothetical protein
MNQIDRSHARIGAGGATRGGNPLKLARQLTILGFAAAVALAAIACGDDDDETTTRGEEGGANGGAVAPPPGRAFNDLATALEAQGLVVTELPKASLDGAEAGVDITGSKRGTARSFATEGEANDYADEVAKNGDKTTIVGTVVFQAASQDDADFFADAYEG